MDKTRSQEISRRLKALAADMKASSVAMREYGATEKALALDEATNMLIEWAEDVLK